MTSTEVSDSTKALTMAGLAEARSKAARSRRASSPASVGAKIPSESPWPQCRAIARSCRIAQPGGLRGEVPYKISARTDRR